MALAVLVGSAGRVIGVDASATIIAESYQERRTAPLALFVPAAVLTITTLAFNFLGDGLRDAFDLHMGRH